MTWFEVFAWSAFGVAAANAVIAGAKAWLARRAAKRSLLARDRFMKSMEQSLKSMFGGQPDCQCAGCTERRAKAANEKRGN